MPQLEFLPEALPDILKGLHIAFDAPVVIAVLEHMAKRIQILEHLVIGLPVESPEAMEKKILEDFSKDAPHNAA